MQLLSECEPGRSKHTELSAGMVREILNELLPKPVCTRTIYRDLQALEFMGFVESKCSTKPLFGSPTRYYHLASPAKIRDRLNRCGAGQILKRKKNG